MSGLLTRHNIANHRYIIFGSSGLTLNRAQTLIEFHAIPIIITPNTKDLSDLAIEKLTELKNQNKLVWYTDREFRLTDLETLGREDVEGVVDGIFLTIPVTPENKKYISEIYQHCLKKRIPINTADCPDMCSFTLLSTFKKGDFQIGVSTSGKGCRLANRIKREAVNALPNNIDEICNRIGELRKRIIEDDEEELVQEVGQDDDDAIQTNKFNDLIIEANESYQQRKKQRLRWLSQVVEYYPLSKLAMLSVEELSKEYSIYKAQNLGQLNSGDVEPPIKEASPKPKGKILLVGAGPGSSDLLTTRALRAIKEADIILSDKLVPAPVLDQIPRTTPIHIAKKFPGNAEQAQQEFLDLGLKYASEGKTVVRLKQGDPYIFGRGGEEFLYFKKHGIDIDFNCVVPGITSALSAPLAAGIPPTHREVADQVLICTGTGRRGALPNFPEWEPTRTCVFLMSLHRIDQIVTELTDKKGWDENVPCCVIERANCPDQRIIRSRLKHIVKAIEESGSRPPGLLVTGYACEIIVKLGVDEKWRVEQ